MTFFCCYDEILSSMKGQRLIPGVMLLIVFYASQECFVGRHLLGALLDFHLT